MPVKTEGGVAYHADAYLYVPDPKKPSTWKLRVKEKIKGSIKVTRIQLGRAAAALGPGFRGQRVQVPPGAVKGLKARLVSLYRSIGVKPELIPHYITAQSNIPGGLIFEGRIEDLFEGPLFAKDTKAEIDEESGTIKAVAMLGPESKNHRRYRPEVMKDAVQRNVYENLPCYIDHNPDRRNSRRVRDLVGRWINVRYDETTQRVRGDLKTLEQHRGLVMDLAKNGPELAAPSHVVEGKTRKVKTNGKTIEDVEHIAKGYSVDLVAGAATVASLMEGRKDKENNIMEWKDITLEEIQTARPDLIESIKADAEGTANSGIEKILRESQKTINELKTKLDESEAARKKEKDLIESTVRLKKMLDESVLPEKATETLMSIYKDEVLTEDQAKKIIESQVSYLETVTGKKLTKTKVDLPDGDPDKSDKTTLSEALSAMAGLKMDKKDNKKDNKKDKDK